MKPTGERNSAKPKAREGRASGRERVQARKKIAQGKRSETSAAMGLRSPNITSPERAAELSPIAMRPGILPAMPTAETKNPLALRRAGKGKIWSHRSDHRRRGGSPDLGREAAATKLNFLPPFFSQFRSNFVAKSTRNSSPVEL